MRKIRCLAVDDTPSLAELYRDYITNHAELDVVLVTNDSREAMRVIQDQSVDIDLVFTDLEMPDYSGLDLLAALEKRRSVSAYLVTGATLKKEDIASTILLGVLEKPLFPDKFERAVQQYIALQQR